MSADIPQPCLHPLECEDCASLAILYGEARASISTSNRARGELVAALERIASCESHHPGDVVAIARAALARARETEGTVAIGEMPATEAEHARIVARLRELARAQPTRGRKYAVSSAATVIEREGPGGIPVSTGEAAGTPGAPKGERTR